MPRQRIDHFLTQPKRGWNYFRRLRAINMLIIMVAQFNCILNGLSLCMHKMNAGYFLIQVASEKDKERVYKLCAEHSRADANGVPQVCFVGVIDPLNPTVETPEAVRDELVLAAKHIPVERLGSTDDCGFSPFSIDKKPKHGSPDMAREIAFKKIAARVQGTRMASEKLSVV